MAIGRVAIGPACTGSAQGIPVRSIIERRLQLSGIILMLGLIVQALCLILGGGAMGFMIFACLGGLLVMVGIIVFLVSLVAARPS